MGIYQSPLYYPKQGWGGKDKLDWSEWAKEKEGGSDEKVAASQNEMKKKKKEEKEHVHEEEDQARPRTFPDDDDDEDERIQLIQKAIRGNHDHYRHDHRDHHESGRW